MSHRRGVGDSSNLNCSGVLLPSAIHFDGVNMFDHALFFCSKVEVMRIPIAIFKPFDPRFMPRVSLLSFEERGFGLFQGEERYLQRGDTSKDTCSCLISSFAWEILLFRKPKTSLFFFLSSNSTLGLSAFWQPRIVGFLGYQCSKNSQQFSRNLGFGSTFVLT